jgi:hypothetical protein
MNGANLEYIKTLLLQAFDGVDQIAKRIPRSLMPRTDVHNLDGVAKQACEFKIFQILQRDKKLKT